MVNIVYKRRVSIFARVGTAFRGLKVTVAMGIDIGAVVSKCVTVMIYTVR